jgi:chaperonin GroES
MKMISVNKINPLENRIIVKPEDAQQKTAGGIVLPSSAQETPHWGIVLKAGPGKRTNDGQLIANAVQAGDRVIYGQYAGTKFKVESQEYIFLREEDIMGVEIA